MSNPEYIYVIRDRVVKKARVSYDHPAYGFYQIYIPCGDEPGYESVYPFPISAFEMDEPRKDETYIGLHNQGWWRTQEEAEKWLKENPPENFELGNYV